MGRQEESNYGLFQQSICLSFTHEVREILHNFKSVKQCIYCKYSALKFIGIIQLIDVSAFFFPFQLLNIVMLNIIIPGFWNRYAQAVSALLTGDLNNWMKHSEIIFPKLAKCAYKIFGSSGTLQSFDAFCLLPLNILNQKLFIIVWIWYIVQLFVSILNLLYWVIISHSENMRIYILRKKSMNSVSHNLMLRASRSAHLGNFFILNQIAKNTNPMTFVELVSNLALNKTNPN